VCQNLGLAHPVWCFLERNISKELYHIEDDHDVLWSERQLADGLNEVNAAPDMVWGKLNQ
jgi:hypothetical protein